MRKTKVRIGYKCFESIHEAAKSFGCSYLAMLKRFKAEGELKNNILTLDSFELRRTKKNLYRKGPRGCHVLCTTTNKEYDSISAIAKAIGVDSWTMGLKMEKAGKFIDKNGNEYIRLTAMNTNRDYPKQRPDLARSIVRSKQSTNKKVENAEIKANNTLTNAIDSIRKIAIEHIQNGSYAEASNLLEALTLLNK